RCERHAGVAGQSSRQAAHPDSHQQYQPDPRSRLRRAGDSRGRRGGSGPRRPGYHAMTTAWTRAEFERRLRAQGARYHIHHPYHRMMHAGECSNAQIRGWVANRFYYQINIPIKDANVMANCPDPAVRQAWVQRIIDHDGAPGETGGIEAWLALGEAVGLTRDDLWSQRRVLPGVR